MPAEHDIVTEARKLLVGYFDSNGVALHSPLGEFLDSQKAKLEGGNFSPDATPFALFTDSSGMAKVLNDIDVRAEQARKRRASN